MKVEIIFDENNNGWVRDDADHSKCQTSMGICESITHGRGECTEHGYWEFPCYHCAREGERKNPQFGEHWPFTKETIEKSKNFNKEND